MNSILARYSVVPVLVAAGLVLAHCTCGFAQIAATPSDATPSDATPSDATPAESQQDSPPQVPAPLPTTDPSPAGDTDQLGYQALMQGPVHEAFAAPVDMDLTDGVRVYSKPPPEPVDERPPEASPEEKGMKWIPGYWSWSDDENDYVWVSGLWRKFPPGRTWNAGSWTPTGSGYRWTSGYWSRPQGSTAAVEYLPLPPKSIDNGPSVPPPAEDAFWVPGQWQYADADYQWQSGFWSAPQADWIWQPACYVYTPQGYLSVDGYWDYVPTDRGQLYAPVVFYNSIYRQPNYVYRPYYPLADAASLLLNLFVRPGCPHYYYGDFRGPSYVSIGYRPWYDHSIGHGYASPWLSYYDAKYRRSGINFVGSMQRYESHLRANPQRPSPQRPVGKQPTIAGGPPQKTLAPNNVKLGRSLDDIVRSDIGRMSKSEHGNRSISSPDRTIHGPSSSLSRSNASAMPRGNIQRRLPSSRSFDTGSRHAESPPLSTTRLPSSRKQSPSSITRSPSSSTQLQSDLGRSSFRSSIPSPSMSRRSMSPTTQSTPSFNRSSQLSLSPSTRAIGSSPSFQRGPSQSIQRSPSQSIQRSPSQSIQRSPSQSLQRSSSPSFRRGSSPSLSGGRGASGFSGRSDLGGGSNRGSFGGGGGGGSKSKGSSKGSKGRGKGK